MRRGSGYQFGLIDAKLAEHDRHFAANNGSLDRLTNAVITTNTTLDRLVAKDEEHDKSVEASAKSLKEQSEKRWNPVNRLVTVLSGIAAFGTLISTVVLILHH